MPTFPADSLHRFTQAIFEAGGVPPDEAAVVARGLVDANLCGHDSHGLIRIPQYLRAIQGGELKPGAPFTVVHETPAVLAADAGWGLGQVQGHRLLQRLIPRARQLGLAAGTLKRCGHIGRLGEYAEAAAAAGLASVLTVNNDGYGRSVAPPGGTEGRIGTNPLCLGVPTQGEPVFLDMATCAVAEGKVRVCFNKGEPAPPGWLLDAQGQPTTDAGVLYREPRGSILPLGGAHAHKGFGLGLLVDMFSGGFSGSRCSHPGIPLRVANAVFLLLLDPEQFAGREHFLHEVTTLAEDVRTCPRAEGVTEMLVPGDPERKQRAKRQVAGIPLDGGTWAQLAAVAEQLRVPLPS